jgi:hypothetical protein
MAPLVEKPSASGFLHRTAQPLCQLFGSRFYLPVAIFCPEPHNPFERILFASAGFLITQDSSYVRAFSIVDTQQL